ncbi:MAG: hypothetical protein RMX68_000305 [Aulosira sp. ZfuVER01]|nr:hypothetical protein [Aulosira sp. ZfuVER01]MDZ8001904.1 hypothetical protein [Aulosira sp. DedVER01a]MDZ8055316.1 hypothetical protein [Aulosira sp. ZfuCHP01]
MILFRHQHPVFRQDNWLNRGSAISWFNPDGSEIKQQQWQDFANSITIFLNGREISPVDDSFLLFFNAGEQIIDCVLPNGLEDKKWQLVIDTTESLFVEDNRFYQDAQILPVMARSLLLLRCVNTNHPASANSFSQ